ncbi:MAG: hypothetical protein ACOYN0_07625 [Phycisphaerales bacterium]
MCRRASKPLSLAVAAALAVSAPLCRGQDADPVAATWGGQTDAYLSDRGLDAVLAARLREQLRKAQGVERQLVAESLGKVYSRMLDGCKDTEQRKEIEVRCKSLIESVPEVESFELRVELARSLYLTIENFAESKRLLLTTPEQDEETVRVLRSVGPQFEGLSRRLGTEVERLTRRLDSPGGADADELRRRLDDAASLRSKAAYYAGWSLYYLALMEDEPKHAARAMEDFGVILGGVPGRAATVERMTRAYLRYPHYARSAIGCALCASILGRDVEAQRWLDAVDRAEDLAPEVAEQVFRRRIIVLAENSKWSDLSVVVRTYRSREGAEQKRLDKGEARLLAVLALDAGATPGVPPRTAQLTAELAQLALGDLVAMGEISHVNDLFRRFGTAPIAETGFIAMYLRGLDAYEQAQQAHATNGGNTKEPASDPGAVARYREAADLLRIAVGCEDAEKFPVEVSRGRIRLGLSLFFAGDFEAAADSLELASAQCATAEDRREALWYAIVALDRAVLAGRVSLAERCDSLAALLVKQYPGSDRAVALLPRLVKSSLISGDEAIKALMEIPVESPLYLTARSEAVAYLYAKFSAASGADRDFAALRVAEVGEEVVKLYHALASAGLTDGAREASERMTVRARQVADVVLQMRAPDLARAEAMLSLIETTAAFHGVPLDGLAPELNYYRFRIAINRTDEAAASEFYRQILASTPTAPNAHKFIAACDNIRFTRAWDRFHASPGDAAAAREVVLHGQSILSRAGANPAAAAPAVMNRTAEAAFSVWKSEGDAKMRDLVMELDTALCAQTRTVASIRRLAHTLASTGKQADALDLWDEILGGVEDTSDPWFEARVESLRLLIVLKPADAVAVMQQHRVLHPDLGPERWRPQLEALEEQIKQLAPAAPPAQPATTGGGP